MLIKLTTGNDTVSVPDGGVTVSANILTLNPGDRLSAGGTHNVLALYGSAVFDLNTLAQFSGFSDIELDNPGDGFNSLVLRNDGSDISITAIAGPTTPFFSVTLANGRVSYH